VTRRAPFHCDNAGVVGIGNDTTGLTYRNRWMRVDDYNFRDFQRTGGILVTRNDTQSNPTGYFTSPICATRLVAAIPMLTRKADG
jgi:hypothetical protein